MAVMKRSAHQIVSDNSSEHSLNNQRGLLTAFTTALFHARLLVCLAECKHLHIQGMLPKSTGVAAMLCLLKQASLCIICICV